jgi:PAS domain S-box-containing protein
MLAGLVLLEALSIALFAVLLISHAAQKASLHAQQRLVYQATSMAAQATEALQQQRPGWIELSVKMMGEAPDVAVARITDPAGNVLFVSQGEPEQRPLEAAERAQIALVRHQEPHTFVLGADRWESVKAIYTDGVLRGFAWVETDRSWDHGQLKSILDGTIAFGIIWIAASALLVFWMARSISRPLAILRRGTSALISAPEESGDFPLPVVVHNEIGDLIEAFNRMVASLAEQHSRLSDMLSLLDSMLANAIVGLAIFDRNGRIVRVNPVFASMTGAPLSHHLGRTLPELLPLPVAKQLEEAVRSVFAAEKPVRNLELSGPGNSFNQSWTWLANAYPVRTTEQQVRWVGLILMDDTDRKRAEDALRKSEKLAVTGRLAASIAHEINNPLEAITNLLFLLHHHCPLEDQALNYVVMAEDEARRIAEITQQTLRFYRQSTHPTRASMAELLDSVLTLYQGRLNSLHIQVERDYDPAMDLFCFAGEIRQVLANLVGNSIDAVGAEGSILIRARRSQSWKDPAQSGVRFTVADSGVGMEPAVRERIFDAFFTTKESTGTGLGLWVSQEIIEKHRGQVHVRSRTSTGGKTSGAVFQLFIPDDPALAAAAKQTTAADV